MNSLKVAFEPKHKKFYPKPKVKEGSITPKTWQTACRTTLAGIRFAIISAPCGSGKSIAILLKCIDEIVVSKFQQKQLIVVPQKIIGQSFTETVKVTNGKTYTWMPAHNFINYKQGSVIKALRKWLLADPKTLQNANAVDKTCIYGISAVCSHQALAIVWRKMTKAQRKQAIHNLTLSIDEAHHIRGVFDEINGELEESEKEEANHLGDVVQAIVNSHDCTARVTLGTATFYRGDAGFILHESIRDQFTSYTHTWIEHWDDLCLDFFRMEYRFYTCDPIDAAVQQIEDDPKNIYLVYIPATGNAWRTKHSLKQLLNKIYAIVPADQVLDLVTKSTQKGNTQRFRTDTIRIKQKDAKGNLHKPAFRVIVACGIGLEGMDYPPASRLLNLACQNSVTRAVQVIGRPMRRFEGKNNVLVYNYIHEFIKGGKYTIAELLADRTNALLTCMAWEDFNHPIMVTLPKVKEQPKQKMELAEAIGHDYQIIFANILKAVEYEKEKTKEEITEIVTEELAKHHITAQILIDSMVVRVIRELLKASPSNAAHKLATFFDISMLRKAGFNVIEKYELSHQTIFFGDCSKVELEEIRHLIESNFDEWIAKIKAAKKKGLL